MPRIVDPRWGETVPRDPPVFLIEESEAKELAEFLGVSDAEHINAMKAAVDYIGEMFFARQAQDEEGPTRAERNEALKQLAEAEDFVWALGALNHRAEGALMDALYLYSDHSWQKQLGVEGAFSLIEKVKRARGCTDLDIPIDHMRKAIRESLPRLQRQRGPDYGISLSLAVDEMLDLYHRVTGKAPTHSVIHYDDNTQGLNSKAGRFVVMVFDQINQTLAQNNQRKIASTSVFTEFRRAVQRFKVG